MDYAKQSEMLKALAHPVRLRLVEGLLTQECHVDKMVMAMRLPQSTVSQHLGILRSRGIVSVRKDGVKTCYSVKDQKIAEIIRILRRFPGGSL